MNLWHKFKFSMCSPFLKTKVKFFVGCALKNKKTLAKPNLQTVTFCKQPQRMNSTSSQYLSYS